MTHEEHLNERRQALNAAINKWDLESITSFVHPSFVCKARDGSALSDYQTMMKSIEQMRSMARDFHSQVEVEAVDVSGDSAKLVVRRTERGRMYNPGHLWGFLAMAAMFAALAVNAAFRAEQAPFQFWYTIVGYAVFSVVFIWLAFRGGLRSMHQTQRVQETWRMIDGRWLLVEEQTNQSAGGVRKRSAKIICGLPLYDIAMGPDPQKGEVRGRAHGIIAIGDFATGWLALGGVARGIIAIGGVAFGVISFGGVGIGLLALGGLAIGGVAIGGGAIGVVAFGGGAVGYYACGGGAWGKYVVSAAERSPEAVEFFRAWIPKAWRPGIL